jgi:hypothetical protein
MFSRVHPSKTATILVAFLTLALNPMILVRVYAQVAGATLSGTVTDQSGALIPNGQISIVNVATGVTREVATDPAGFYTAPNLIPGTYEVTASAPGFATQVQTGITLTVGAQEVLNVTLTVRELPLNGRSWTDLATLQPGVDAIQTQLPFTAGTNRGNRGFGDQITVSGARLQQNNYRLDGVSINDISNGAPGSVLGGNLGVDAIQEFSVLTSNYSAEYGRTSGGVVNAITRSGTNQFHGGVYEFLRNGALDTARVDGKISDKDSLAATYLGDITPYRSPDGLNTVVMSSETNRQIATLEYTHIFSPTLVNSARIGYSRDGVLNQDTIAAINPLADDPSLAAWPAQSAAQVTVPGLTAFNGGVKGNSHFVFGWNSFQGYDDAFWTHGAHSLKFGGAVERMDANSFSSGELRGSFVFGTLPDFLTNHPKRFKSTFPNSSSPRGFRQTLLGFYTQDDWRVRTDLTVNMGLRWEMVTVLTEVQGKLAGLHNITDPTPHLGSPFFSNPTYRNFGPRVGFAWDPFHGGTTAVRGGFGVFDALPLPYQFYITQSSSVFPFNRQGVANKLPPGSFYTGAPPLLGPTANSEAYVEQDPHRNYVMQWNINVQRELVPHPTAVLGFVGSRAVHQPVRVDDTNIVIPTKTAQGYLFPAPTGSGTGINPHFGLLAATFMKVPPPTTPSN